MSEEVLPKKRTRAPRTPSKITTRKGQFVCDYTNAFIDKAVFIPGFRDVCFLNLPCAVAYLERNSENEQDLAKNLEALATSYGQTVEQLVAAPDPLQLLQNGGKLTYDEWIGDLAIWDAVTDSKGLTVDQWKRSDKRKPKKAKPAATVFEPGVYLVKPGKAAPQKVNAVDAEKGVKGQLTVVAIVRKLDKYMAGKEGFEAINGTDEKCRFAAAMCVDGEKQEKEHNVQAEKLTGINDIYGPAMFVFTRKFSLKE